MHTADALLDLHERTHRNLAALLVHCRRLDDAELNQELPGFGYSSVRLQLHHAIGAEEYWIGVLRGSFEVADDEAAYPTVESLEAYRCRVFAATEEYLHGATPQELNTSRNMLTWGNKERLLVPANVILRTQTHLYHHQGQVVVMCRLLDKPAQGLDYPID